MTDDRHRGEFSHWGAIALRRTTIAKSLSGPHTAPGCSPPWLLLGRI